MPPPSWSRSFQYYYAGPWAYYRRQPSRLLWFIIGASAAAMYLKERDKTFVDRRHWGACVRAPIQVPQNFSNQPMPPEQHQQQLQGLSGMKKHAWAFGQQDFDQQWEADKQKLMALGKQAQDTMAELSESTLEAIIATGESMKAKLAQRRATRAKLEEEQAAHANTQNQNQPKQPPSRWV